MQQPLGTDLPPSDPKASPPPPPPGVSAENVVGLIPRKAPRTNLTHESPARMVLPSRQTVYVTLHDISRAGCCVMRKGNLGVQPDDKVTIEFWRENIESKVSLKATVRWVHLYEGKTRAGLRFLDTSVKTDKAIQDYVKRSTITII